MGDYKINIRGRNGVEKHGLSDMKHMVKDKRRPRRNEKKKSRRDRRNRKVSKRPKELNG
jgi:hypothetical protein